MTTASVLIAPPPRETAFLQRDGRVSEPWLSWLTTITVTGGVVQNLQQLSMVAEDNSTDGNTGHILEQLLDALLLLAESKRPGAADAAPDDFLFIPNATRPPADDVPDSDPRLMVMRAELDELRMLVDALPAQQPRFGSTGSFTSADAKTVTVTDGVITSIV